MVNRLVVTGEGADIRRLLEAVRGEEKAFSCNRIIPQPEELRKVAHPVRIVPEEEYEAEARRCDEKDRKLLNSLGATVGGPLTERMQQELLRKYGCDNWKDWAEDRWGSKCDVYAVGEWDVRRDSASISWTSAWTLVTPVLAELSRRFPELTLLLVYGGEYDGDGVGYLTYRGGELVQEVALDWYSPEGQAVRRELGGCYDGCDEDEDEGEDEDGPGDTAPAAGPPAWN
jgi:hypothetical protein